MQTEAGYDKLALRWVCTPQLSSELIHTDGSSLSGRPLFAPLFLVYALISSLVLGYHGDRCQAAPGCVCKQQPEDFADHKHVLVHFPLHTQTHEPQINI